MSNVAEPLVVEWALRALEWNYTRAASVLVDGCRGFVTQTHTYSLNCIAFPVPAAELHGYPGLVVTGCRAKQITHVSMPRHQLAFGVSSQNEPPIKQRSR